MVEMVTFEGCAGFEVIEGVLEVDAVEVESGAFRVDDSVAVLVGWTMSARVGVLAAVTRIGIEVVKTLRR